MHTLYIVTTNPLLATMYLLLMSHSMNHDYTNAIPKALSGFSKKKVNIHIQFV